MKQKNLLIILSLLILLNKGFAQQTTNCGGNSIFSISFSIEYSIGEIGVISQNNDAANLTPGVTQPYPRITNPSSEIINDPLVVFPNPAKNYVSVIGRYNWADRYNIYSSDGNRIKSGLYENNKIDISYLVPGTYLIILYPENTLSYKTVKIIKQ